MFNNQVKPPLAKVIPKTTHIHGDTLVDNYFWLRDANNPDVIAYLEAENTYLTEVMAPTEALQETLYQKMLSHLQETDSNVPVQDGDYFYYTRTEANKPYFLYCRKRATSRAELNSSAEEIVLDVNALGEGKAFFSVTLLRVSPDHKTLAYLHNETGSDYYTLEVVDLNTRAKIIAPIENIFLSNSLEWDSSGRYLFYVTANEQQRPDKLFRYSLTSQTSTLVYHEVDPMYFIFINTSRSGKFLFANIGSHQTSEVHYLDATTPEATWKVFAPRVNGVSYDLEHHGNHFVFLCNDGASNFKLLQTPIDAPSSEHWQELMPHSKTVFLRALYPFANHLVIAGRENGLTQLWIRDMTTQSTHRLQWPEPLYTINVGNNRDFDTTNILIEYQSMLTPRSTLELDLHDGSTTLLKRDTVLEYNPEEYASEQVWANASDGTPIPISLLYKKGTARPAPILLYAYGAYGASYDPSFNSNRLALLDRGVTFATAHVRGGSEMGWNWYEQGKVAHKMNTFTDFIACAEHLVAGGYTTSQGLAAMGLSAGGLLMGAVTTMRPHLFKAVIAKVPFVDVINTMLDASLPLVTLEYEEWGDPQNPTEYGYMKSYSPYEAIKADEKYPHLLVTGGLNDPRVPYWEPAKWVAKLRASKADTNVLILKTHMEAGHLGSSGRYGQLRDVALEYAFILTAINVQV
jgi:oligopeptidase B